MPVWKTYDIFETYPEHLKQIVAQMVKRNNTKSLQDAKVIAHRAGLYEDLSKSVQTKLAAVPLKKYLSGKVLGFL